MTPHEHILSVLETIKDPFLNLTGKEMGLKFNLDQNGAEYRLQLVCGFPTAPLQIKYVPLIISALEQQLSTPIQVQLEEQIRPHRTQMAGKGLRGVKNIIAIASGKGGVGKSTVAVNMATALARAGARVGILDADIYGPSIPLMLGKNAPLSIEDNQYLPIKAHGLEAMSIGYIADNDQALIWRGPMLAKSLIQMLDSTRWDNLDYLFIDLPPGTGDIQLTLVQKIPLTAAIVVTTPQNVATLDAQKAILMFKKTGIDVLGVVENMAIHHCSQCGHSEAIFGAGGAEILCKEQAIRFLGQLPLNSEIRELADNGNPIALHNNSISQEFLKISLKAAIYLAQKPINYADKFPEVIVE